MMPKIDAISRIKTCLPNVSEEEILAFQKSKQASLITVCIWAEQGVLKLEQGKIMKTEPPKVDVNEIAQLLKTAIRSDRE